MRETDHIEAGRAFMQLAREADENYRKARNIGWMVAGAHNFFYAAINFIEAILAKNNINPETHRDRLKDMRVSGMFSAEEVREHSMLVEARRKAGYRGQDGVNYSRIKESAEHFERRVLA